MLQRKATSAEIDASFRRYVARYRATLTVEQLYTDPRFKDRLNAYLTLRGEDRTQYDQSLKSTEEEQPEFRPLDALSPAESQLLMGRVAYWRQEYIEAIHILRTLLSKEPNLAAAWAQLGEIYFILDREEEGIQAYTHATEEEPANAGYASRLQHARDAQAGRVKLQVEMSPEEELLREERRKRWHLAAIAIIIGVAVIAWSFFVPLRLSERSLNVPWITIGVQALGVFALFIGLGFGRLLQPFERIMLWSSMPAGDRGAVRSYPYGLLLFVATVPSMWLAFGTMIVIAILDEEWPVSPSIMLGVCMVLDVILTLLIRHASINWAGTLVVGGNIPVLAAMLGWWIGSFTQPTYD